MKIAVQTGGPEERIGIDSTYRMIAECGFDGVDASLDHLATGTEIREKRIPEVLLSGSEKEIRALARPWGDAAKKYGIDNYQSHAPFPSLISENDEYNDAIVKMLESTIIAADEINCRNLVVHPFFLGYQQRLSPEREWEINIERYSRLIPAAKKYGVTVCLENMFTGNRGKLYAACCSDIDTACAYVDELNRIAGQKVFGFCFDTGHALLCGLDMRDALVKLGDRISAFHVHDNNGINDQHLAPYMGILDWDRFVKGLSEIPFNATMSFETFNIWNTVDNELAPEIMRFIHSCGRMFARRAGKA